MSLSTGTLGPVEDPLTANGFASPSCTTAQLFTQLDPAARRDCNISGDAVAPVPLSNYGLDTHIASGLDASFDEDLDSIIQGLLVTPVWTALVWLVHVVIVALEWCYSIDLLAPAIMGAVASAVGGAERIFTEPWLGLVLTLAGVGFAWNGLVRRRVAETLGQAALMLAMMAVGLWVIADPSGTVGSLSRLADQAALGTVSATATGSAAQPAGSLDGALGNVLDSTITAPWCFLEFGDVNWCRDPSQLDPSLVATAAKDSRLYAVGTTCGPSAPGLSQCVPSGSDQQRADASITLALSAARTNGALFLSLPAGGPSAQRLVKRNSVADALRDVVRCQRPDRVYRRNSAAGGVSYRAGNLAAGWRLAVDHDRRDRDVASPGLYRASTAWSCSGLADLPDASAARGSRSGFWGRRARHFPHMVRQARRRGTLEARLLSDARNRAPHFTPFDEPRGAGLVDPVALAFRVLVARV